MRYAISPPEGLTKEQFSDWLDGCRDCTAGRPASLTRSQAYDWGYGQIYAEEQKLTKESMNENQRKH